MKKYHLVPCTTGRYGMEPHHLKDCIINKDGTVSTSSLMDNLLIPTGITVTHPALLHNS